MWFSHNLEFVTDATGATGAAEVVARPAARTPHPTRAGGQDDGSYTNSLKLELDRMHISIFCGFAHAADPYFF